MLTLDLPLSLASPSQSSTVSVVFRALEVISQPIDETIEDQADRDKLLDIYPELLDRVWGSCRRDIAFVATDVI